MVYARGVWGAAARCALAAALEGGTEVAGCIMCCQGCLLHCCAGVTCSSTAALGAPPPPSILCVQSTWCTRWAACTPVSLPVGCLPAVALLVGCLPTVVVLQAPLCRQPAHQAAVALLVGCLPAVVVLQAPLCRQPVHQAGVAALCTRGTHCCWQAAPSSRPAVEIKSYLNLIRASGLQDADLIVLECSAIRRAHCLHIRQQLCRHFRLVCLLCRMPT